jgi:hypothetical protein
VRLLPEVLGIGCRGVSSRLKEALYDFGLEDSFRLAAYRLKIHYGFSLSAERTRLITLEKSGEVVAKNAAREPVRTLAAKGAEKIVTQCDGSLFRFVETGSSGDARKHRRLDWKEARLCAASAADSATIYYEGLIGDVHETGRLWGHCTQRAGWAVGTYVQSMGDGAPWIEEQARVSFPGSPFLLDICHVYGYLAPAAESCAQQEKPTRWLKRQKNKLLKGKSQQVIEELRQKSEAPDLPDEQAPVRVAHRYLSARTNQIDYPAAIERDLPVGTGMIESAHKQIIQKRIKGPGMAWLPKNAHALIQARAARATEIQNPKCRKIAA